MSAITMILQRIAIVQRQHWQGSRKILGVTLLAVSPILASTLQYIGAASWTQFAAFSFSLVIISVDKLWEQLWAKSKLAWLILIGLTLTYGFLVYQKFLDETAPANMVWDAKSNSDEYPTGTKISGIEWQQGYSDVRLYLRNDDDVPYTDFDVVISTNQLIAGIGIDSKLNTCAAMPSLPNKQPSMPMEIAVAGISDKSGNLEIVSAPGTGTEELIFTSHYRIHCEKIISHSDIGVVLAVVQDTGDIFSPMSSSKRIAPKLLTVEADFNFKGKKQQRRNFFDFRAEK